MSRFYTHVHTIHTACGCFCCNTVHKNQGTFVFGGLFLCCPFKWCCIWNKSKFVGWAVLSSGADDQTPDWTSYTERAPVQPANWNWCPKKTVSSSCQHWRTTYSQDSSAGSWTSRPDCDNGTWIVGSKCGKGNRKRFGGCCISLTGETRLGGLLSAEWDPEDVLQPDKGETDQEATWQQRKNLPNTNVLTCAQFGPPVNTPGALRGLIKSEFISVAHLKLPQVIKELYKREQINISISKRM